MAAGGANIRAVGGATGGFAASFGDTGGAGGFGGSVQVLANAHIITCDVNSDGVLAQSVGGNGGASITGSPAFNQEP